jgi:hypothetical protein
MSAASAIKVTFLAAFLAAGVTLVVGSAARGATVTILNGDAPFEGLNDQAAASPVGGNSGTTRGQQRLIAVQYAAGIWGALIAGPEIKIGVSFDPGGPPATCPPLVLAEGGPSGMFRDFAGAPFPNTWYPQALANRLAGLDLDPSGQTEISVVFNVLVDSVPGCSPAPFYYGLDGNPPLGQVDLVSLALHEFAHGLAFYTFMDLNTGAKAMGFDDIYMHFLEDHSTGKTFPEMTDTERRAAFVDDGDVHWIGPHVTQASGRFFSGVHQPSGHVEMYAPVALVSGASLIHWTDVLYDPKVGNEMMVRFPVTTHQIGLARELLNDVGWRLCVGDCNTDDSVTVEELIVGVNIALGNSQISGCRGFNALPDENLDGRVTVEELVRGLNVALNGCAVAGFQAAQVAASGPAPLAPQSVTVQVGSASGLRGTSVVIPVSMSGGNGSVAGAQIDIVFDAAVLDSPTCALDARLTNHSLSYSFPSDPPVPSGKTRVRTLVLDTNAPTDTFSDGVMLSCTFQIKAGAAFGASTLTGEMAHVSDASGNPLTPSTVNGTITVLTPYQFAQGCYTGSGAARSITANFAPDLVLVKSKITDQAVMRTSTMTGDFSASMGTGFAGAGAVTGFTATGFTLGTNTRVNRNGTMYCWYAFRTGSGMQVGSYAGNGANPRSVATSFSPSALWLKGASSTKNGLVKTTTMNTGKSFGLAALGEVSGQLTALGSNSFTVTNNTNVNASGTTYHWVAWQQTPGLWDNSFYQGDGTGGRVIVGGCTPSWAFLVSTDGNNGRMRSNVESNTQLMSATADATNMIVSVGLFGGPNFIVNAGANTNLASYHWLVGCVAP